VTIKKLNIDCLETSDGFHTVKFAGDLVQVPAQINSLDTLSEHFT
jgi:hypothetical protein